MSEPKAKLKNWSVRRSGATMTISGVDLATGEQRSVPGIKRVAPAPQLGICVGHLKAGGEIWLHAS